MSITHKITSIAISAALMAGTAGVALAQENTAPADPMMDAAPEMETQAIEFSEAQLDAFASAYVRVNEIGMSYESQLEGSETDEELMAMQAEAQQEMMTVVEGTDGLTVDTYNNILVAAQNDPALGAQIQERVDALM